MGQFRSFIIIRRGGGCGERPSDRAKSCAIEFGIQIANFVRWRSQSRMTCRQEDSPLYTFLHLGSKFWHFATTRDAKSAAQLSSFVTSSG